MKGVIVACIKDVLRVISDPPNSTHAHSPSFFSILLSSNWHRHLMNKVNFSVAISKVAMIYNVLQVIITHTHEEWKHNWLF